jgi:high-affinity nickel-transport protein
VTGLSVLVALLVGTFELLSIAQNQLDLTGPFWEFIGAVDLGSVGYVIVGLFILTWVVAYSVWRIGHIEERWLLPSAQPKQRFDLTSAESSGPTSIESSLRTHRPTP